MGVGFINNILGASPVITAEGKHGPEQARSLALKDQNAPRRECLFSIPDSLARMLSPGIVPRSQDTLLFMAVAQAMIWISFSAIVFANLSPGLPRYLWGALHLVVTFVLLGARFILAMHYHSHLKVTRSTSLNLIPAGLMSVFWGMPCGVYALHHTVMHHAEDNVLPFDLSSTMACQRDSLVDFLLYVHNFTNHTLGHLVWYSARRQSARQCATLLLFIGGGYALQAATYQLSTAAFWVFMGLPSYIGSLALMFGNFGQHVFVDRKRAASGYGNTVTMLRAPQNDMTFNDGYHTGHHLQSRTAWDVMPQRFADDVDAYAQADALCFVGLNFDDLGIAALSGRLSTLAPHVLQLKKPYLSDDAVTARRATLEPSRRARTSPPPPHTHTHPRTTSYHHHTPSPTPRAGQARDAAAAHGGARTGARRPARGARRQRDALVGALAVALCGRGLR